jgi:hypothetical protein
MACEPRRPKFSSGVIGEPFQHTDTGPDLNRNREHFRIRRKRDMWKIGFKIERKLRRIRRCRQQRKRALPPSTLRRRLRDLVRTGSPQLLAAELASLVTRWRAVPKTADSNGRGQTNGDNARKAAVEGGGRSGSRGPGCPWSPGRLPPRLQSRPTGGALGA